MTFGELRLIPEESARWSQPVGAGSGPATHRTVSDRTDAEAVQSGPMPAAREVLWPDVVSAIAAVVTVFILLLAGLIAARQLSETRSLRRAQVRPFVVIDFDVERDAPLIFIHIENVGSTVARDVRFTFDERIETSFDLQGGPGRQAMADLPVFVNGIPSLPPGKVISFVFDSFYEREGLRDTYAVTLSYRGDEISRWPRHPQTEVFEESMILDLGVYRRMARTDRKGLHDIHERLQEISAEVRKWSATGGGMLHLSPTDLKARNRMWEENARRQRRSSPPADDSESQPVESPAHGER